MKKERNSNFIVKLIILIILLIVVIICSFKTGHQFYILKNTNFDTTKTTTNSEIAKWYFNAIIIP